MTEPLRITQFSDLHLGRTFKTLCAEKNQQRQADLLAALGRIIDHALAAGSDLILIPGDLFDPKLPPLSLVEQVRRQLSRFTEPGGRVVLSPGNHDPWLLNNASPPAGILTGAPGVYVLNQPGWNMLPLGIQDEIVRIYGYPYDATAPFARPFETLPPLNSADINLVMLHGSYNQCETRFMEPDLYHPFSQDDLEASSATYIAIGHYHRRIECQSAIPAWYSGSPEGLRYNPNEEGPRYFLQIEIDPDRAVHIEPIVSNQRTINLKGYDLSLTGIERIQEDIRQLADTTRMLKITLTGAVQSIAEINRLTRLSDQFKDLFFDLQINHDGVLCAADWQSAIDPDSAEAVFINIMQARLSQQTEPNERHEWQEALLIGLSALQKTR